MIILFMIKSQCCYSQKIWSLQDCVDHALENNIQVKREKLNTLEQENNLKQAKLNILPEISAGYMHQYKSGFSFNDHIYNFDDEFKTSGYAGLESDLTLFDGFANLNKVKMYEYELEKSLAQYHEFRNYIILEVASSYLHVLLDQEMLEIAKNQLEITTLQVKKTNQLVEVGNVARGELMKIMALEANDKLVVVQADNQLNLSYLNLIQLLELETKEDFEIVSPDLNLIMSFKIPEIKEVFDLAYINLPQIKRSELNVKVKETELKMIQGDMYPDFHFRTSFNSWFLSSAGYDSLSRFDQLGNHKEMIYSLELSIPVFSRWENKKNFNNAKIQLKDADYLYELEKKKLFKEIQQAHADAVAALNKYMASEEAVTANTEAFKYTEQKFNVGLVTSVDYNLAKNELLKARSELLISKYNYIFKVKVLDFYTGKPFTL